MGMDKYAQAFAEAMEQTGMRNTTVAEQLGGVVVYNNVSQWRTGRRPIPAEHAVPIARLLGVPPERISKAYERQLRAESAKIAMSAIGTGTGAVPGEHVVLERLAEFGRGEGPERIWLPQFLLKRELALTQIEHIRWTIQLSRAMEPEIKRFGLVLVDTTANRHEDLIDGNIYAYTLWGRADIRRVAFRRDGWSLVASGRDIERVDVDGSDLPNLQIHGAFVGCF